MLDSRVPVELAALPAGGRPRLKRLRFVLILFAVLLLGLISFVFGMFVAVASDLPSLTNVLAVQERAELGAAGRPRPADRGGQRTESSDRHPRGDPPDRQGGGDLDRGQALSDQQRGRHPRNRTCVRPGHRAQRHGAGRFDDRAAVHQERAASPVAPDDLREAARGGARLPALTQVVEGKDHRRLPQHDLFRQRRLRDRVRRTNLFRLRAQPRRLRNTRS